MAKNLVLGPILTRLAQIPAANFFPQKSGFISHWNEYGFEEFLFLALSSRDFNKSFME